MGCCLERARRVAFGPFRAHFEERVLLKYADYPLHQTLTHRRCGAHFLAVLCGEDRDPATWRWICTRWILIPLTSDELADMEYTPTSVLGGRRQTLIASLRADRWLWLTEGPERGVGQWGERLSSVRSIAGQPPEAWPKIPDGPSYSARSGSLKATSSPDAAIG